MAEKPIVFISCGQCSEEEINLGNRVEKLIREETDFEPYFAQQQSSLDGLVAHVLSALDRMAAFIAIMHHRGTIARPDGNTITRGSVWVEQELAIAAFIRHALKRDIQVAAYLQDGIALEGIRQQLLLGPIPFESPNDVLEDLRGRLPAWNLIVPKSKIALTPVWTFRRDPSRSNSERHEYNLKVEAVNEGEAPIEKWHAELWFPGNFVGDGKSRQSIHQKVTHDNFSQSEQTIWPAEHRQLFNIRYFVDYNNWPGRGWPGQDVPIDKVKLRLNAVGMETVNLEIPMKDIQEF